MPAQCHAAEVVWVFRVWLETVSALSERNCEAMYVWFANALQSA